MDREEKEILKKISGCIQRGPSETDLCINVEAFVPFGMVELKKGEKFSGGDKVVGCLIPMPGQTIEGQKIWLSFSASRAASIIQGLQKCLLTALGVDCNDGQIISEDVIAGKIRAKLAPGDSEKEVGDEYLRISKKMLKESSEENE